MKSKKKLSLLLVITLSLSFILGFSNVVNAEGELNITSSNLTIGGVVYSEGMTIKDSAEFIFDFNWSISNNAQSRGHIFTIDLPNVINFEKVDAKEILRGQEVIGNYSIAENKLTIVITDANLLSQSNITGGFVLSGTLNKEVVETDDNSNVKIKIFDKTFKFKVKETEENREIHISKELVGKTDSENLKASFLITIRSVGDNKDVVLEDSFGQFLSFIPETFTVKDSSGNVVANSVTEGENKEGKAGFLYEFVNTIKDGEIYTIEYSVAIDPAIFAVVEMKTTNTAVAWFGNDERSEEAVVHIGMEKKWITKKNATLNTATSTASWSIVVNPSSSMEIGGAVFSDNLPLRLSLASDIVIWQNNKVYATIPKEEFINNGYRYTFPEGASGEFQIIYTTNVDLTNYDLFEGAYIENTAEFTHGIYGVHSSTGSVKVIGIDILTKTAMFGDSQSASWMSTILVPEGGLNNLIFTDTVDVGYVNQKMDTSSLRIYVTDADKDYVSGDEVTNTYKNKIVMETSGFSVDFGDDFSTQTGKKIVLVYDTQFSMTRTSWARNDAQITSKQGTRNVTANYKYTAVINKDTKSDAAEQNNTVYPWRIVVDRGQLSEDVITIIDKLPENQVLVEDSIYVADNNNWNETNQSKQGISYEISGSSVIFTVDTSACTLTDNKVILIYRTKIDDIQKFINGGKVTYTNVAEAYDKDGLIGTATAQYYSKMPDVTKILDKTYKYTRITAPYVIFDIPVNELGYNLVKETDKIVLMDTMGNAMDYVPNSLKIYTDNTYTKELSSLLYSVNYNTESRTLTIQLPDELPCYIRYEAKILLSPGELLNSDNAFNTVQMEGVLGDNSKTKINLSGETLKSAAYAESTTGEFTLYKYADDDQTKPLANAKYKLWIVKAYDPADGKPVDVDDVYLQKLKEIYGYSDGNIYTTDEKGFIQISNVIYDHLYAIQEIESPDGYILDSTIRYYFIQGNDKSDFNSLDTENMPVNQVLSGKYIYQSNSTEVTPRPSVSPNPIPTETPSAEKTNPPSTTLPTETVKHSEKPEAMPTETVIPKESTSTPQPREKVTIPVETGDKAAFLATVTCCVCAFIACMWEFRIKNRRRE